MWYSDPLNKDLVDRCTELGLSPIDYADIVEARSACRDEAKASTQHVRSMKQFNAMTLETEYGQFHAIGSDQNYADSIISGAKTVSKIRKTMSEAKIDEQMATIFPEMMLTKMKRQAQSM